MAKAQVFTTRIEIRKALQELLRDKLNINGKVYANRVIPMQAGDLPVVLIYPESEESTILRKDPYRTLRRDLRITIQIIATDSEVESLSDCLDNFASEIEKAIEGSNRLGNIVHDINIDNLEAAYRGEGQKPEGSLSLNYNVTYVTKPTE